MKKAFMLILAAVMFLSLPSAGRADDVIPFSRDPVIGIAWRADADSEFFVNVCRVIEEAGGTWVMLDQVLSADLPYDEAGRLDGCTDASGALDPAGVWRVRGNTWNGSNAAEAVGGIGMVISTGGEDISPSLYGAEDREEAGEEADYCAERDVSDYLTMAYCLDNDIPVVGFCRGMQMLSVVSGAELIQSIPDYYAELSLDYADEHRNETAEPGSYRDYAPHSVQVEEDSLLYGMVGTDVLEGCPSWHRQAVRSVDGTPLAVTGYYEADGIRVIRPE